MTFVHPSQCTKTKACITKSHHEGTFVLLLIQTLQLQLNTEAVTRSFELHRDNLWAKDRSGAINLPVEIWTDSCGCSRSYPVSNRKNATGLVTSQVQPRESTLPKISQFQPLSRGQDRALPAHDLIPKGKKPVTTDHRGQRVLAILRINTTNSTCNESTKVQVSLSWYGSAVYHVVLLSSVV